MVCSWYEGHVFNQFGWKCVMITENGGDLLSKELNRTRDISLFLYDCIKVVLFLNLCELAALRVYRLF